jgi:NAD(P)H-quinone oxidoreductase subunit 4
MLAMYNGQIGLFASQDLLLFLKMLELELIPLYLFLSMWRGNRCIYAVTKIILYTISGFIFLLIRALTMGLYGSNEPTWDFHILVNKFYPT